jgi:hypothetical protein
LLWFVVVRALCLLVLVPLAGCEPEVPAGLGEPELQRAPGSETPAGVDAGIDAPDVVPTSPPPESSPAPASPAVDGAAVLAAIAASAYQTSPAFTQVTQAPYASVAAPGSMVLEWVSTPALAAYESISPGVTGSDVVLPVGTMIVRAVLDGDGGVGKLTIMFKGPAGYNPALGDWWFGVTDPDGSPLSNDAGVQLGKLEGCYSCHVPRSSDGYLFGVPLDDRVYVAGGGDDAGTTP